MWGTGSAPSGNFSFTTSISTNIAYSLLFSGTTISSDTNINVSTAASIEWSSASYRYYFPGTVGSKNPSFNIVKASGRGGELRIEFGR